MARMIRDTREARRVVRVLLDSRRGGVTATEIAAASGVSEGATKVIVADLADSHWLEVAGRGGDPVYALSQEGRVSAEELLRGGRGRRWRR